MSNDSSSGERGKWAAVIVGIVVAVPILALHAPEALLAAIVVGSLAWAGVRSGVLAKEDGETTTGVDPLSTLQERYAAGDLSEAEFERRLDRILESDEEVRRAAEAPASGDRHARDRRERKTATERE